MEQLSEEKENSATSMSIDNEAEDKSDDEVESDDAAATEQRASRLQWTNFRLKYFVRGIVQQQVRRFAESFGEVSMFISKV
jgi:hypothetical protein